MLATKRKGTYWAAMLLAAVTLTASITSQARAAGLLVADGGFGGVLEIKEHDVKVTINNGIAVTEVNQVFVNTENRIVEALYTFPVPKGASIANFSMWIGGKEMIGEVVEKERARKIYESYKKRRVDPGLLEQVDYKKFEMRIFPIAAGAEQRVRVTYYQELDADHDWATYVYPLATVTRGAADQRTTGRFAFTLQVKSEVPIVEMESPSHGDQFVVAAHSPKYFQASLETRQGSLNRDLVIAYRIERPRTGFDIITSRESGDDGYLMLTLTAGKELAELNKGMDYVFILDVSGSMAHDGKLSLSRGSLGAFIDSLGKEDRFEVIAFNVQPTTLFNSLHEVTDADKQRAAEFLRSQKARGGTVLRSAINTAYRYRDNDRTLNVVVLSDGMTEQREQRELLNLIANRPSGTRVFCIGVGNEVNRPLLRQIAQDAGGLASFISRGDDFERQAAAFRRKLMRPAATNLRVKFEGGGVYDLEPQKLPNLYHGSPLRLLARYQTAGSVKVTVTGDVLGSPIELTKRIELPETDARNPQIERMWAWHRVQELLRRQRDGSSNAINEIVDLCERYSITSQYASFIVLENDGEYKRWKIERRNVRRIGRDRQARQALRDELNELRQQAEARLGPSGEGDTQLASAEVPGAVPGTGQPRAQNNRQRAPRVQPSNSGGGGGGGFGGAIDPISAAIGLGLVGAGALAARRKRRRALGDERKE
ncbi:MAG: VWA domain-containing protein [Planctomycetes bacterium]|nr:VWA domain-containing protein [Planctomycetota bacterium]